MVKLGPKETYLKVSWNPSCISALTSDPNSDAPIRKAIQIIPKPVPPGNAVAYVPRTLISRCAERILYDSYPKLARVNSQANPAELEQKACP